MNAINVLIAEDNKLNQIALRSILNGLGYNLLLANDGQEALELAQQFPCSIFLLDVQMPNMNGFEAAEAIRAIKGNEDIPIVFLTASASDTNEIEKAFELNAVDYIFKPYNKIILRSKVQVLIDYYQKSQRIKEQAIKLKRSEAQLEKTVNHLEEMNHELVQQIRERTMLQDKLEESLKELAYKNRELKEFAYIVSHDLKSPLRAIGSLAGWLSMDYADVLDETGQEQLALMQKRVNRMNAFIDGILLYSRIGRLEVPKVYFDLNHKLENIIDLLDIRNYVDVQIEGKLPFVFGEEIRIEQVFQNLIDNAVKFNDKVHKKITIRYEDTGEFHQFQVSDNGPGIDNKYFDKIFKIFQTLSPRDTIESTGIGLTVVQKIIQTHRGKISVDSTLGEGTTFTFTLPKRQKKSNEIKANNTEQISKAS